MTTSIPEAPHSQRNWDYRYCWLRDAYFVVHTLNRLSATLTLEHYLRFIQNIVAQTAEGAVLQPLYSLTLDGRIEERVVERSEEHTSELQSLMRISYAVFCLTKKTNHAGIRTIRHTTPSIISCPH